MAGAITQLTVMFIPKAGNPFFEKVLASDLSIWQSEIEEKVNKIVEDKSFETLLHWFNGFDTIYVDLDQVRAQIESFGGYSGIEKLQFDYENKNPYEGYGYSEYDEEDEYEDEEYEDEDEEYSDYVGGYETWSLVFTL